MVTTSESIIRFTTQMPGHVEIFVIRHLINLLHKLYIQFRRYGDEKGNNKSIYKLLNNFGQNNWCSNSIEGNFRLQFYLTSDICKWIEAMDFKSWYDSKGTM